MPKFFQFSGSKTIQSRPNFVGANVRRLELHFKNFKRVFARPQNFPLARHDFVMQSHAMNPNLAEQNLQTIRLLMERSALYRRALAPIMLVAGVLGLIAAGVGLCLPQESPQAFGALWLGTACIVVTLTFLLARRQAFKDDEPFWSPPTYRVGQALLPPLFAGMLLGGLMTTLYSSYPAPKFWAAIIWMLFYGCALHSAGFFMARGIKWFGWVFIASAFIIIIFGNCTGCLWERPDACPWFFALKPDAIMGFFFGGLHVAYGTYLYFTEKKSSAA
jgi:hypothetical protein